MHALVNAGLIPVPSKSSAEKDLHDVIHGIVDDLVPSVEELDHEVEIEEKSIKKALARWSVYPSLNELKLAIDNRTSDAGDTIKPPSIEPLEVFIEQRTRTIIGLKKLRASMAKHIRHCQISNTVGNSASIVGGILCFFFPIVGVPVLLAGSATTLGTSITGTVIEKRLQKKYTQMLQDDSLAMQMCESNLKDITTWLVTVYSLGYSVSKAGVDFLQLAEAIQASSTLGAWSQLIGQLPSLSSAFATGAKTASTISGQILGVSVIISVADLIQTWVSKNATLESIDKDIATLEEQLVELKRVVEIYHS